MLLAYSVITIHATSHYVKFFHFEASIGYQHRFKSFWQDDDDHSDSESWLHVRSTSEWFDICTSKGREMTVRHLLALVQWVRDEAPEEKEDVETEEDVEMEDESD
jgi:DNA-directed RNA polymerase specialized sigma24 family protein